MTVQKNVDGGIPLMTAPREERLTDRGKGKRGGGGNERNGQDEVKQQEDKRLGENWF